ncbi:MULTISPECIES: NmrA family NAD(P)-binding protein [Burkholderia]|uniref:NmrA family transcriptional regulator n=1 Tax=Burkholderia ubonensis TaxID=101571 RepID=A0A1B4LMD3_9BURK|nr:MULTISPECIES: NmrA family NAD(P)-binding protein [Burkholderia]AOJ78347.1 NmrA family transcriptional regulator [Burkholderia ubonensis]AOK12353.1 NmrA family transcriptional regulator [Burkholderia vietnamiensis]KVF74663.1 NmrA family transcriptional regulator [Burkholderia vietnamiensis]KVF89871.1 NmrA family transcriptional regulator [Burkholderia vietnamiensis]KVF90042.1 NmrA family transcriptional regulator [Burkholderia vietnamiensis]
MDNTHTSCLVVGAAGNLGHRIIDALLRTRPAGEIRAGVRGGSAGKHGNRARQWLANGVTVVNTDLDDPLSLEQACAGVDTVISAVQGGPDIIVDGQARLLEAALAAGVRRLVPSDFSENLFSIPEGINPYLDMRRTFDRKVVPSGIGHTHILNGGFMEAVFSNPGLIDAKAGTIAYWGDDEVPLDFTSMNDVAAWTVAAVEDPAAANRIVSVAGDCRTIAQIAADYAAATGKELHRVRRGSIADGYAELRRMAKAGAHPMAMLPLQYLLPMMSGEGTLRDIANDQYPTVRPTSLLDFMKRHYEGARTKFDS